ncbi:MAG: serine/threonine-protein kinase [Myxococcota bacterium]
MTSPFTVPTLAPHDRLDHEDSETLEGSAPAATLRGLQRLKRGAAVGRYIVLETLGCGAMGIVYTAYDPDLDRKIALKLLLPGRDGRPAARLRLQREAQAIARLAHPNVVAVHDVGMVDDGVFIAMEFVDGVDLARWLTNGERSLAEILDRFMQAGRGLAAAHAAGLVHRDFKPENVLLGLDGRARVVDFGLVRADESSASLPASSHDELQARPARPISQPHSKAPVPLELTEAGTMIGTPAYMSPEQFAGQRGDARSDQFSFCVSLYEGLYGERPFEGTTLAELSHAVIQGELRGPAPHSDVPGRLRRVLLRGLHNDPDERYPSMDALLVALRRASAPQRRWWITPTVVLLAAAGVAAAVTAAWSSQQPAPSSCDSVGEWVGVMWGAERQAAIEQAFERTQRPFAGATWTRVKGTLDLHLERWVELQRSVCEQTSGLDPATVAADPRQRCLEQRMAETSDLLAVLEQANERTVTEGVRMANSLSSVDDCTHLDTVDPQPTPRDPQLQGEVQQLRSEIRRWTMQTRGRHTAQTDQAFDDLVGRVQALEYPPLTTEMLVQRAERASALNNLEEAIELSNLAFETALSCRYDTMAFDAAVDLLFLHGIDRADPKTGHRWARRAEALLTRTGGDIRRRISLLNSWASVHTVAGEVAQAQARYDEALALVRQIDDPMNVATVLNNIGAFHAKQHRMLIAQDYLEEAAHLYETVLGPDHPSVLRNRSNLGVIAAFDHRGAQALEILEDVLPRLEAIHGTSSREIATTLEAMAMALTQLGQFERALALRHQVIEMQRVLVGPAERPSLQARLNLGSTYAWARQYSTAHRVLSELQQDIDAQSGVDVSLQVELSTYLARTQLGLGRSAPDGKDDKDAFERSRSLLTEALARCRAHDECSGRRETFIINILGWSLFWLGDHSGARQNFEEVTRRNDPALPAGVRLDAQFGLARIAVEDDPDAARARARQLLIEARTQPDLTSRALVEDIEQWLDDGTTTPEPR